MPPPAGGHQLEGGGTMQRYRVRCTNESTELHVLSHVVVSTMVGLVSRVPDVCDINDLSQINFYFTYIIIYIACHHCHLDTADSCCYHSSSTHVQCSLGIIIVDVWQWIDSTQILETVIRCHTHIRTHPPRGLSP